MKTYSMNTQVAVRLGFWEAFPELDRTKTTMNGERIYKTDTRCAFVDYVDALQKGGQISERLAQRVTL